MTSVTLSYIVTPSFPHTLTFSLARWSRHTNAMGTLKFLAMVLDNSSGSMSYMSLKDFTPATPSDFWLSSDSGSFSIFSWKKNKSMWNQIKVLMQCFTRMKYVPTSYEISQKIAFSSYVQYSHCSGFKMIYYLAVLLPYSESKPRISLFSINFWHVQWAISPLVRGGGGEQWCSAQVQSRRWLSWGVLTSNWPFMSWYHRLFHA